MRVVDVAVWYGPKSGGIRTYLEEKARYARETGNFEHHYLVPARRDAVFHSRHDLRAPLPIGNNGYRLWANSDRVCARLEALQPDVIVLHEPWAYPRQVSALGRHWGASIVGVLHTEPSSFGMSLGLGRGGALGDVVGKRLARTRFADMDVVMCPWPEKAAWLGRPLAKLRLGLDTQFFAFGPQPADDPHRIMYVGRFSPEKQPEIVIDALRLGPPEWTLDMVGHGPVGALLRRRAIKLGVGDRVRFLPFETDRARLGDRYARAGVVVLPGRRETGGFAALEAMATGTPVVVADSTPLGQRIAAPAGLPFQAGDPEGLAAAIAATLAFDRGEAARAARASARTADARQVFDREFALYTSLRATAAAGAAVRA